MSQNMRYYLKVLANFILIQILPAKVGRPMLNFGRPIVKCTPKYKSYCREKTRKRRRDQNILNTSSTLNHCCSASHSSSTSFSSVAGSFPAFNRFNIPFVTFGGFDFASLTLASLSPSSVFAPRL